jgi:hypothetical protein
MVAAESNLQKTEQKEHCQVCRGMSTLHPNKHSVSISVGELTYLELLILCYLELENDNLLEGLNTR